MGLKNAPNNGRAASGEETYLGDLQSNVIKLSYNKLGLCPKFLIVTSGVGLAYVYRSTARFAFSKYCLNYAGVFWHDFFNLMKTMLVSGK